MMQMKIATLMQVLACPEHPPDAGLDRRLLPPGLIRIRVVQQILHGSALSL
jgi:hypothetical protein